MAVSKKSNTSNMKKFAESQESETSKKSTGKSSKEKGGSGKSSSSFWQFLSDRKMVIFYGILLVLFSILLFISIFSFYFNAHESHTSRATVRRMCRTWPKVLALISLTSSSSSFSASRLSGSRSLYYYMV